MVWSSNPTSKQLKSGKKDSTTCMQCPRQSHSQKSKVNEQLKYTDNQQYVEYTYNGLRFSLTKETHSGTWYYMGGPWRLYVDKLNIPQIGSTYTHFIIIIF